MALLTPVPFVGLMRIPGYIRDWRGYARAAKPERLKLRDSYPRFADSTRHTPFDPHYFYQGAWLARYLFKSSPETHLDVGSSVTMVGVLSAMVETVFVDYRPLRVRLPGLTSVGADIFQLPFASDSVESVSCLHVIEHVGLGRYGDPLDPKGSLKAASELQRILKPGGRLYLSVPVGRERVCFNAHRVFDPETIMQYFSALTPVEFSFVDDEGRFREYQDVTIAARCEYGCGMFVFEKPRQ